jgi:hypothetical protein
MHKLILIFLVLFIALGASAQPDIPVGSWRTHNAYNKTIALVARGGEVYAATNSALYSYNPADNSFEQITGLSGLSDTDISALGYNEASDLLITTFANGNIDLIRPTKISNFKDLLLADIPGSKKINHVFSYNELVYLSADFGVMVIDLAKEEVKDSYFELGASGSAMAIYSSTIYNDTLYLATEEGIIGGFLGDNLKDFNQWRRYGSADGVPEKAVKVIVQSATGIIAAFDEDGLFENNSGSWVSKNLLTNKTFRNGNYDTPGNLFVTDTQVYRYNGSAIDSINSTLVKEPRAAIYLGSSIVVGDYNNGLVFPEIESAHYPNGPFSNDIVRLFGYEDKMVALPRAYDDSFLPLRGNSGFFIFSEGEWVNFNSTGYPGTITIPEVLDFSDAMYSYATGKLFLASFGYGILEINGDQYTLFDDSNSTLINSSPPDKNILVTAVDANSKALTAVNFNASAPYQRYDPAAENWDSRAVSFPAAFAVQLRGFENNTYWMQVANQIGGKIIVYDYDNQRELVLDNSVLPSELVNDMVVDRDGKMWVATDKGVVYFYNPENILDQSLIDPVQPIYQGQILFRNEKLTALAVDGGNRIWMATTAGVWLFASDGFELLENFNAENSPLPSNNVYDIAINHQTGEVFFATDGGLVSYRGTATISSVEEPLKIFPNPVLRNQHDIVTIQGVPTDANFWITDSSGRLVYRSTAEGNTATWSGISSNTELSSGVYFVFVASENGNEKQVGKIAIVN